MPHLPQLGAPDPELKNSPIVDEFDDEELPESRDLEPADALCYFNGVSYTAGAYVQSGSEVLQCTDAGVWTRRAERDGPPG